MSNNFESDMKHIPYKAVVKKKALEYYYANKEVVGEKNKRKYKSLSPEQKRCLDKQSPEKKEELRQKARNYQKTDIKTIWYRLKSRELGAL